MSISLDIRKRKKGTVYKYIVRVRTAHFQAQEQMTFPDRSSGLAWAKQVEKEMLKQAAQDNPEYDAARSRSGDITLKDYLEKYQTKIESLPKDKQISHRDMLAIKFWQRSKLGKLRSNQITGDHLIKYLDKRLEQVTPSTNHLYVSVLRRAIDWQKRVGYFFKQFITDSVMKELWKLKLVGKSRRHDVRPTTDQVLMLYRELLAVYNYNSSVIPYHHLMLFSIYSTFREGEICGIKRSQLDRENGLVIIEDRKDPSNKFGNHQKVPIPAECIEIIDRQPVIEGEDRIFPYKAKSVSSRFSILTETLGFPEVRFHSFRHDGISRLFEHKMSIPEVALRSGHKTWEHLRRYTHLLHNEPADLWGMCKVIENEYWQANEIKNPRVREALGVN
ncbi:tyrosine-type recombinase/integrase [Kistimonas asteriae]|uniref:tyrosine-type recombinase/integrase n=1 Tax=Kistimonas asteriae TaxID=517724 RepID=UPI001BA5E339|nr:tyrosine-type recombinase/integrase [Kistimonas asteriae]